MERLTYMSDGYYAVDSKNCYDDQNEDYCGPAIDLLARYEETGLLPERKTALQESGGTRSGRPPGHIHPALLRCRAHFPHPPDRS